MEVEKPCTIRKSVKRKKEDEEKVNTQPQKKKQNKNFPLCVLYIRKKEEKNVNTLS